MRIECIAIGSEFLCTQRLDTNSIWIAEKLAEMGLSLCRKTVVGDAPEEMRQVFKESVMRSDIVICTGGLGSTFDDLTKEVWADVFGVTLRESAEESGEAKKELLFSYNQSELNHSLTMIDDSKQAFTLDDADVLINKIGTAPGIFWSNPKGYYGHYVILLPGVFKEMKDIWEQQVSSKLKSIAGRPTVHTKRMVFGLFAENIVCERTKQIREKFNSINWIILANRQNVELIGRTTNLALLEAAYMELKSEIGSDVAFIGDSGGMVNAVVMLLAKLKHTLSVAESMTGGSLASCLASIPHVSEVFLGGAVVYSATAKMMLTNLDANFIAAYGTVSEPVTVELALAIRNLLGTTWSVAITGNAGPTEDKDGPAPIGTCFIAIAGPDGVKCENSVIYGDRAEVQAHSVILALDMLRRRLLEWDKT